MNVIIGFFITLFSIVNCNADKLQDLLRLLGRRSFSFNMEDGGAILGIPDKPSHLPAAEPIMPGHTLIRPTFGMLKSALKFPHKDLDNGAGVYGNIDKLGLRFGLQSDQLLYTSFRRMLSDYINEDQGISVKYTGDDVKNTTDRIIEVLRELAANSKGDAKEIHHHKITNYNTNSFLKKIRSAPREGPINFFRTPQDNKGQVEEVYNYELPKKQKHFKTKSHNDGIKITINGMTINIPITTDPDDANEDNDISGINKRKEKEKKKSVFKKKKKSGKKRVPFTKPGFKTFKRPGHKRLAFNIPKYKRPAFDKLDYKRPDILTRPDYITPRIIKNYSHLEFRGNKNNKFHITVRINGQNFSIYPEDLIQKPISSKLKLSSQSRPAKNVPNVNPMENCNFPNCRPTDDDAISEPPELLKPVLRYTNEEESNEKNYSNELWHSDEQSVTLPTPLKMKHNVGKQDVWFYKTKDLFDHVKFSNGALEYQQMFPKRKKKDKHSFFRRIY